MTAATVSNWTITFTMPAAHDVIYTFNATLSRSGDAATLRRRPTPPRSVRYDGVLRVLRQPPGGLTDSERLHAHQPGDRTIACTAT